MPKIDYESMSNEELFKLLMESSSCMAAVVGKVDESNRQTVIAFLILLADRTD